MLNIIFDLEIAYLTSRMNLHHQILEDFQSKSHEKEVLHNHDPSFICYKS